MEKIGKDGWKPLHYDNKPYWFNNCWDAPKADQRILKALTYLVTPVSQGGAGHEHIRVGRIVQDNLHSNELNKANKEDQDAEDPALLEESRKAISSHYVNNGNPHRPSRIAQAVDITEIDYVRVTTKITKKKRVGGSSTEYRYQSFPIKVAWQTKEGIGKAPLPNLRNMYEGADLAYKTGLAEFLDSLDLGIAIDLSTVDAHNFSGLASIIGESLVSNLLGGIQPKGNDLPSTLESFGRAYLAQQLGLPTEGLKEGASTEEVVSAIGRSIAEQNLGLPSGSLKGTTSQEIYGAIARRYLEAKVFKVEEGTLGNGASLSQDQLLKRLGLGKIARQLGLEADDINTADTTAFFASSPQLKNLFTADQASYINDLFGLTYAKTPLTESLTGANNGGNPALTTDDFADAAQKLINGTMPLARFLLVVGTRTVDSGIGAFDPQTPGLSSGGDSVTRNQADLKSCNAGPGYDPGTCISGLAGESFGPGFLAQAGTDMGCLMPLVRGNLYYANHCTPYVESTPTVGHTGASDPEAGYKKWADTLVNQPSETAKSFIQAMTATAKMDKAALIDTLATFLKTYDYYHSQVSIGSVTLETKAAKAKERIVAIQTKWKPLFQAMQDELTLKANKDLDQSAATLADKAATAALAKVSRQLSVLNQDLQGAWDARSLIGQSGRSAALNLPGTALGTVDAQGLETGEPLFNQDPVNAVLKGDFSALPTIGKLILGQSLSKEKSSQYALASLLEPDPSPDFKGTARYGITDEALLGYGVIPGDFERIFTKNLGEDVFSRIGKSYLLGKAWNKGSLEKDINQATGSPELRQSLGGLDGATSDPSFYAERYASLVATAKDLAKALQRSNAALAQTINVWADKTTDGNAATYRNQASSLAVLTNQAGSQDRLLADKAKNLAGEIVAGRSLDFTQAADPAASSNAQSAAGCWTNTDLRRTLVNGNGFGKLASTVASCQLESSLGLPGGSIEGWVKNGGSSFSYDALAVAIGTAKLGPTSGRTDAELRKAGEDVIRGRAVSQLTALIPGYNAFASSYRIDESTVEGLLRGNPTDAALKVGGGILESRLKWPAGTVANLINPSCKKKDGTPCTSAEIETIRLKAMGQAGLNALGAALGFPGTFDISGGGTFIADYGRAALSELLGLSANTFQGSFTDVKGANSPKALLSALGMQDTPIDQKLSELIVKVTHADADKDLINQVLGQLNQSLNDGRGYVLNKVGDKNSPFNLGTITGVNGAIGGLVQDRLNGYKADIQTVANLASGSAELSQIIQPYLNEALQKNAAEWISSYGGSFAQQIIDFRAKAESLAQAAGLPSSALQDFIAGKTLDAGSLLKEVGLKQLADKLGNLDKIDDPILYEVLSGIPGITGSGCSVSQLILGNGGSCGGQSIANVDLGKLLTSNDPTAKAQRDFLFDHLLGRALGSKIEEAAGFDSGTLRNFILDPRQGGELLLAQGLNKIAEQIFKGGDDAPLRQAFLAGFFDAKTNSYAFNFNQERLIGQLELSLANVLENTLSAANVSRALGITISEEDLHSLLSGNVAGLLNLGMQDFVLSINKKLDALGKDPHLQQFKLGYDQVSLMLGIGGPKAGESTESYKLRKQQAQQDLQNRLYDIAAVQLDKNMPAGFARAMLFGNDAAKADVLGEYLLNAVGLKDPLLIQFIADLDGNFQALTDFISSGFTLENLDGPTLTGVQNWLSDRFAQVFDIPDLPPGIAQSFLGWASTGFDPKQFDAKAYTSGVFRCGDGDIAKCAAGLGTSIQSWGQAQLLSWSDNVLGFKPGTTYQIYQDYKSMLSKGGNPAALAADIINLFFSEEIGQLEQAIGLVPGTGVLLLQIGINLLMGVAVNPAVLVAFLAGNLFGVYKVVVESRATADGYYPYKGSYGASGSSGGSPPQYPSSTWPTGEFDIQDQTAYRKGIMKAAQAKVDHVLANLLTLPESDWADAHAQDRTTLYVSQIYTARSQSVADLEYRLQQPAPWESKTGTGYGLLSARADLGKGRDKNGNLKPTNQRFNVFPDPVLTEVHVRW